MVVSAELPDPTEAVAREAPLWAKLRNAVRYAGFLFLYPVFRLGTWLEEREAKRSSPCERNY
ncbi:MAG: hypothetical protein ABI383_11625 [Acidobacteriaceae bacterium]